MKAQHSLTAKVGANAGAPSTRPLLLHFRQDKTRFGVRRDELKEMAQHLGSTETMVVHMALSRLHMELFPDRYASDGEAAPNIVAAKTPGFDLFAPGDKAKGITTIADFVAGAKTSKK